MGYLVTDYAGMFKALSDDTRLHIIKLLFSSGELCGCHILEHFKITQPTLSYHMKILTDNNIVIGKKNGPWTIYTLNRETIDTLIEFLKF